MTKVTILEGRENAPMKEYIKDFNLAFANKDIDYILYCFADDARWEMVGGQTWDGREDIAQALRPVDGGEALELVMDGILSHDNKCVANAQSLCY